MTPSIPFQAYIPGGPFPRPVASERASKPIDPARWRDSSEYCRGFALFDAGCYWEAHEVWEALWHVHGRKGEIADLLKALIKLAAAGVKVRQNEPRGVTTHSQRASEIFVRLQTLVGPTFLGLDLTWVATCSKNVATKPHLLAGSIAEGRVVVFPFRLSPIENYETAGREASHRRHFAAETIPTTAREAESTTPCPPPSENP
jgi:hypothetical protein